MGVLRIQMRARPEFEAKWEVHMDPRDHRFNDMVKQIIVQHGRMKDGNARNYTPNKCTIDRVTKSFILTLTKCLREWEGFAAAQEAHESPSKKSAAAKRRMPSGASGAHAHGPKLPKQAVGPAKGVGAARPRPAVQAQLCGESERDALQKALATAERDLAAAKRGQAAAEVQAGATLPDGPPATPQPSK
jgi:hypothetical protein